MGFGRGITTFIKVPNFPPHALQYSFILLIIHQLISYNVLGQSSHSLQIWKSSHNLLLQAARQICRRPQTTPSRRSHTVTVVSEVDMVVNGVGSFDLVPITARIWVGGKVEAMLSKTVSIFEFLWHFLGDEIRGREAFDAHKLFLSPDKPSCQLKNSTQTENVRNLTEGRRMLREENVWDRKCY